MPDQEEQQGLPDTELELIQFYAKLRRSFPSINAMAVWKDVDVLEGGVIHYQIFSEIGDELVRWVSEGEIPDALALLDAMESACIRSKTLGDPIYTDFMPALVVYDASEPRIKVASMLKPALTEAYRHIRPMYTVPDQAQDDTTIS